MHFNVLSNSVTVCASGEQQTSKHLSPIRIWPGVTPVWPHWVKISRLNKKPYDIPGHNKGTK